MADFTMTCNGAVIDKNHPLLIAAGQSATKTVVVQHGDGVAALGKTITLDPSCPVMIEPGLEGMFDATGKFTFVVGPSFGPRGPVSITVKDWKKKAQTFEVRFN